MATLSDRVELSPPLLALSNSGDRATLLAVARLLLITSPPAWLSLAVGDDSVVREYIPRDDLDALKWLEPDLDDLLRDAFHQSGRVQREGFIKWIGDAAELFLMAAFKYAGIDALHVAKISDAYGYDIEAHAEQVSRVEVKAASQTTRGTFILSRNEYEKSVHYGKQWRLLQVVFGNDAFIAERLQASHVLGIWELAPAALASLVPPDSPAFTWLESAKLKASDPMWNLAPIELDPAFTLAGYRLSLKDCAVGLRSKEH